MHYIIVFGNLRFRSSTRKREASVYKIFTMESDFEKNAFLVGQTGKKIRLQTKKDVCGRGPMYQIGDRGENVAWKVNSRFFKVAEVVQLPRPLARGGNLQTKKVWCTCKVFKFCLRFTSPVPTICWDVIPYPLFQTSISWMYCHLGVMPNIKFVAHNRKISP